MDIFNEEKRRSIMSKVKNKDSQIETKFRKKLWQKGFHYRKNSKKHFGKPDITFSKYKVVIFIDSCFWHFCPMHREIPETNKDFWLNKLESNKKRDEIVSNYYKDLNWKIIRIWEHEIKNESMLEEVISDTIKYLK